jgi:pimeloyl-ACP methyl ester carboxylesterase
MALGVQPMGRALARRPWRAVAVALLLLGGAGCAVVVKNDQHQVFSKPRYGEDRFILVRDYNIHYVEAGEGEPLLLIPGAFTTYRTWNRVLPQLSVHNRVLAVDYVGVGDSDKPERGFHYTVEEQADVLAEMIVALQLPRVNVVGASYGGAVALNLAARYPGILGKVVCIEGGALITPEALDYSKLGALIDWPVLGDITWGFMKSGLFDGITARSVMGAAWDTLTPEEREEVTGIFSANIQTVSRSSWMSIYRAITDRIDFIRALKDTRVPILYLYGEDTKYRAVVEMNVRNFEALNPRVKIIAFKGGIHELHLQYPQGVAGAILRFLGTVPGKSEVAGGIAGPGAAEESAPGPDVHQSFLRKGLP